MAKKPLFSDWNEFRELLTYDVRPGLAKLAPPTDDEISRFEKQIKHRIPASYRSFLNSVGPGRLDVMKICSPGKQGNFGIKNLWNVTRTFETWEDSFSDADYRRARRVVTCMYVDDSYVGWDPGTVVDEAAPEYAFLRIRDSDDRPVQKIGNSFLEAMQWFLKGTVVRPAPWRYVPATGRPSK